jgi:transcriptional regulator with XRE-family HTH domain
VFERRVPTDPVVADRLFRIGLAVRAARQRAGLSQEMLERRSGIDQTTISRVERGMTRGFTVESLVRLKSGLGEALVLFTCPHPHECIWSARVLPEPAPGAFRLPGTRLPASPPPAEPLHAAGLDER